MDTDNQFAVSKLPSLVSTKRAKEELGGIGQTKLYELLGRGELDAVKIGRKTLITGASIERFIHSRSVAQIGRHASQ